MERKGVSGVPNRRQLLLQMLPAGAFACLLCRHGLAAASQEKSAAPPPKNKFQEPCEMSYEQLFNFTYGLDAIPLMKAMRAEMGREKFIEFLKRTASAATEHEIRCALKKNPKNDLATYLGDMRKPNPLFKHALTFEVVEDTPTAAEMRVTECLWAKTFREADAADIGYAMCCHPDFAAATAFNPKIKMTRTKTLMQENDCCNHRWVMEA